MSEIDGALAASRQAAEQLLGDAESLGPAWATPRAPGKWSPSQIVEHIARSLDASVALAHGQPSSFPKLPGDRAPGAAHRVPAPAERPLVAEGQDDAGHEPARPGRRRRPRDGPGCRRLTRDTKPRAASSPPAARRSGRRCSAPCRSPTSSASWSSTCATTGGSFREAPPARSPSRYFSSQRILVATSIVAFEDRQSRAVSPAVSREDDPSHRGDTLVPLRPRGSG